MAVAHSQVFEDDFPLVRSCAALNEIRIADEIQDLKIEVQDGGVLHAHRIIIAARIPSLQASLRGQHNADNSVIKWPTVPLSIATTLVNYVYTGQVEITQANVRGIALLARMLNLPVLENWGATFLANGINLETLATAWDFAKSLNSTPVMEVCIDLMQKQFQDFVQSDHFVSLPAATLLSLLQKDDLAVTSEEEVFAAISRWVCPCDEIDQQRLELHAPVMLKEVRWSQTTSQFRRNLVEQWMNAAENDKPPCPFNPRTRAYQALKTSHITQNRSRETNIFVFGMDTHQKRFSVYCFDSNLERADRVTDMEKREYASYAVIGAQSIFVIGGKTPQQPYSTNVKEFLVREHSWRDRAPLAIGRRCSAVAVVIAGGEISLVGVFGGFNGQSLSSSELYDTNQDRWFKLPDLRDKRSDVPAAASLPGDSRIFVFGGLNGPSYLASVEFCELGADWQQRASSASTADFWRAAVPMRTARSKLAATHFRGKIIVAGGDDKQRYLNAVELFTPPDANIPLGQWTALPAMQNTRVYFTLVASANAVFALGNDGNNTAEAFIPPAGSADTRNDLSSWMWSSRNPVQNLRSIWGAVSLRM